jgi:hypothetical protein
MSVRSQSRSPIPAESASWGLPFKRRQPRKPQPSQQPTSSHLARQVAPIADSERAGRAKCAEGRLGDGRRVLAWCLARESVARELRATDVGVIPSSWPLRDSRRRKRQGSRRDRLCAASAAISAPSGRPDHPTASDDASRHTVLLRPPCTATPSRTAGRVVAKRISNVRAASGRVRARDALEWRALGWRA